jgi:hypothetical protein
VIYAQTNAPYPNRVQIVLSPYIGPISQGGPFGTFDPRRDLQVYVDGQLQVVQNFAFDAANNRYLLYTANAINLQGVIQVVYAPPNPAFQSTALGWGVSWGSSWGGSTAVRYVPGFALRASYSTQGDSGLLPQLALIASPTVSAPGGPVTLVWQTANVAQILIAGNNGVDPAFRFPATGLHSGASGVYTYTVGFTDSIVLTMSGYDSGGNPIAGLLPVAATLTVT